MAVAGGNAAVPAAGERVVGSPKGLTDEAHSARAALSLPRAPRGTARFFKKTRTTPDEDWALARKRQKELE
jgi:hypothetical protein